MFGGDEDAEKPSAQIHHGAGTPPGAQTGRSPVHPIHLNTAGHLIKHLADYLGGLRTETKVSLND